MNEENPDKLTKLFEDYKSEYIRGHPYGDGDTKRRRVQPAKVVMWQAHRVCLP